MTEQDTFKFMELDLHFEVDSSKKSSESDIHNIWKMILDKLDFPNVETISISAPRKVICKLHREITIPTDLIATKNDVSSARHRV